MADKTATSAAGTIELREKEEASEPATRPARGHSWRGWVIRRLFLAALSLFIISVIIFLATHALPSDPAQAIVHGRGTPEEVARVRASLGLDKPLLEQYFDWLFALLRGDLGTSLTSRRPVSESVAPALANSLVLLVITFVLVAPLSVWLGVTTARRRDGIWDRSVLFASMLLTALPEFVVGMVLVTLFATVVLDIFPATALIPADSPPFMYPAEITLPILTLMAAVTPYMYRLVRAMMSDILDSEYVAMARLKGMPMRIVMRRHALPNALVPFIQACSLVLAYLLGGVVIVEYLFRYPGLGSLLTEAVSNRDLPMIEACVLVLAGGVVMFSLISDLLTIYLTPRLRTGGARR